MIGRGAGGEHTLSRTSEWVDKLEAEALGRAEGQRQISPAEIRAIFAYVRRALREGDSIGVLKAFVPLSQAGLVDARSADPLFRIE